MTRLTGLLTALAAALVLLIAPTGTAGATTAGCSTWQYYTNPDKPIYASPGDTNAKNRTANIAGAWVNVRRIDGDFRYGNFYFKSGNNNANYETGWIWVGHLTYYNCW